MSYGLRRRSVYAERVEYAWDKISSMTWDQAGWLAVVIALFPNREIWTREFRNIGSKRTKATYHLFSGLQSENGCMKWMVATESGLPKSWNGRMTERRSIGGMSCNISVVPRNARKSKAQRGLLWAERCKQGKGREKILAFWLSDVEPVTHKLTLCGLQQWPDIVSDWLHLKRVLYKTFIHFSMKTALLRQLLTVLKHCEEFLTDLEMVSLIYWCLFLSQLTKSDFDNWNSLPA